jgi:hypothetical protein
MGTYDVATALALYAERDQPSTEPMHGQLGGEPRRNPSTDQKKVRRLMTQKKAAEASQESLPALLARAASASTLDEQQQLMTEYERRVTERTAALDAERSLDLSIKEAVTIVPRGTHELHTESTDWLMSEGLHVTASAQEAEQALVVEASLWFTRVPDYVKADGEEYLVQARNLAQRTASQYGDAAPAAEAAFMAEAKRLYRQGQKTGSIKTAGLIDDLSGKSGWDELGRREQQARDNAAARQPLIDQAQQAVHGLTPDSDYRPSEPAGHATPEPHGAPHQNPEGPHGVGHHIDTTLPGTHDLTGTPHLDNEVARHLQGADAAGVGGAAHGYAEHALRGGSLQQRTAALHTAAAEDAQLAAVLAGVDMEGGAGAAVDDAGQMLDSSANGVRESAEDFAQHQMQDQRMAASTLPQVGMPTDEFPTLGYPYPADDTGSDRAPALQEIQNFTGWDGDSVVPGGNNGAESANNDQQPTRDFASTTPGFPVSGSTHAAKVAAQLTKESSMDYAACPNCAGQGRVAVRHQAYSGLPQVDQIVNADESPGETQLPEQVAFPLTGWGATPQQGQQNVQNAINQAEQQIATRPQGVPMGGPGGAVTSSRGRVANGPDASGWLGDMGAKGLDYPGNSAPVGYDGSSQLGQPDPVYGYGGDQGNRPLQPYGEMEANDVTNNPQEPYDPTVPHDAGQAYRTVAPGMSTQGAYHPDPYIEAAQRQIREAQQQIANRNAALAAARGR